MHHLVLAIILSLATLVASLPASANESEAARDSSMFEWTVRWGQPDQYGYLVTNWTAKADPTIEVKEGLWLKYLGVWRWATYTVDSNGVSSVNMEGRPGVLVPTGITFTKSGASQSFTGSTWNLEPDGCPNGPTLTYKQNGSRVTATVKNTTGKVLYATTNNSGPNPPKWKKLRPGKSLSVKLKPSQYLSLFTRPEYNPTYSCADISYYGG